ncbi:MAG: TonB-dependent receptor [Marinibacterium sp.]|nr:TonB-dependent receptor [Marinibacterium sp.]
MAFELFSARTRLLCGSALVAVSGSGAFAQDLPDDTGAADAPAETITADAATEGTGTPGTGTAGDATLLDPIIVRAEDPLGGSADRASSVYVADAELEAARLGNMRDVFAGIANVSVGGAIPLNQKIFVNGVDMLNLSISMDGALQNNRAFHHVSANVFDPGLLKFVRVDPGIAAADTGPNAVAGAVVMETIDAGDVILDGNSVGGNFRLSYADNGNTRNAALTLAARSQGFEVLAYGRGVKGDDYKAGNGDTVAGTAADLQSGLLKFAYETDTGHRFELTGQKLWDSELRNFRSNFGPSRRPMVEYDTERSTYSFNYAFTQGGGMWDPEASVGFSESKVNAALYEKSQGTSNTLSAKVQNTFHLSPSNTIVAGVDFYDRLGQYKSDVTDGAEEKSRNIGLFAQARFEPTDRWKISAGARADFQHFEGGEEFENDYSGLSGNLSAVYALTDELSVRAGYSNVFGGLQLEDNYLYYNLYYPGYSWDYDTLKTSRAQNYNLGLDWTRGGLTIGGELFLTEVDNVRDGDENFDFSSQGLNLQATYGWAGGFARLTYTNSESKRDGDVVSSYYLLDYGAPIGQIFALEVQQEIPTLNMMVGGSVDLALDYDLDAHSDLDVDPLRTLPGYGVVNLFAEYHPPALSGVSIRGEIRNLFDENYSDRATYGGDYVGFNTLSEPGRTFVIEAVARF